MTMQVFQLFFQRKYFLFSAFLMMTVLMLGTIFALMIASSWLNFNKGIIHSPATNYDYIIVGAGTAGCVIASHLVRDIKNPSVLLIEAGEYFPWWSSIPLAAPFLQETSYDWSYRTVPQTYSSWGLNNETSAWPRGRGVGGSGKINYMVHFSGTEDDFESWKKMGVEGWSYNNIQSTLNKLLVSERENEYFSKTYSCSNNYKTVFLKADNDTCQKEFHEKAYKMYPPKLHITSHIPEMSTLAATFIEGGELMKTFGYNKVSFTPAYSTVKDGYRWSTLEGFLKPVLAKRNLHILLNTVVSKILFSEERRAIGIETIKPTNQTTRVYSKKEIILCSGSINSPQILLLSGIGPHQQLQKFGIPLIKDLPVGLGLHDHLNVPLYVSINNPISITMDKIISFSQLFHYIIFREGYLASSGIIGVGSVSSNIGIVLFGLGSVNEDLLRRVANYKLNTFRSLFPFSQDSSQEGFVLLVSCLQPVSRGFVTLQSADPIQPPIIDPQYLSQRQDIVCMAEGVKFAARLIETQPFRDLGARLHLPHLEECKHIVPHFEDDAYLECLLRTAAITGYHPAGTCKMGKPSDPTTVVNSFLRVHGTSGLRVVDASVLPSPVSGHPNSLITILAERAASFILNSTESDLQK